MMLSEKPMMLFLYLIIGLIISEASADYLESQSIQDYEYQREHSLVRPYQSSGMTIPGWEFFGSTIVTGNYIRLTPDTQSKQGGIWNIHPYQSNYWEVEVAFNIHGKGTELFGDGLAIWYVSEPPRGGPIFGNRDYFSGLAVILDTYANQQESSRGNPYISTMVNNGTLHYDHEADGLHSELAGCESKFRGLEHDARILIQYLNNQLTVKTDLENSNNWRECLKVNNVYLPPHYYFGITSATGDLSDNHDIISIKMRQLSPALVDKQQLTSDLPRADYSSSHSGKIGDHEAPAGSGVRKFFMYLFVMLAVVAVAGFGYFLYTSRRNSARKRFY